MQLTMLDRPRKTLHLPAKPDAEPAAKPAEKAAPAKPKISPDEQRAREAADQEAKRIRIAALSKDAEALKSTLIDRYPHLFAVDPPRPLASGMISPDDQQVAVKALQRRLVRSPQAIARRKERKTAAAARS
jgi:hypothetical protein